MRNLKKRYGNTALITGGSSGIGEEFARGIAAEGVNLILVARRKEVMVKLGTQLSQDHGITVEVISQDLSLHDAADQVYNTVQKLGLEVDILVNNAGYGSHGPFEELDLANEMAMVDLNCRLPVALTHKFLPGMKKRGKGAIIITASVLGQMPAPYMATYSATKAFDVYFAESLYGELKGTGVDVLAILPGYTTTGFKAATDYKDAPPIPARKAPDVVKTALGALGKTPSVTDGLFNKMSVQSFKWFPKKLLVSVAAMGMKPKN